MLQEIEWYDIDCNYDSYIEDIETSFTYLEIINSGCELSLELECEIKNFITKKSSFCVFTSDECDTESIIEIQNNLMTEDDNALITENDLNIQF